MDEVRHVPTQRSIGHRSGGTGLRHRAPARGRWRGAWVVVLVCSLLVAAAAPARAGGRPGGHPGRGAVVLDVATYNLFLGADLTPLFDTADPAQLGAVAAEVWGQVQASRPEERLGAVADVLVGHRPDVVGLQEVARWETAPWDVVDVPNLGQLPVATGPYEPVYDFLALLLDALEARGVAYEAVAVEEGFSSAVLPFAVPVSATEAVRFTDRDVILVRRSTLRTARVANAGGEQYTARFTAGVLGQPVEVTRGWVAVDLSVRGRTVRILNTHLEAYGNPLLHPLKDEVRNPQAVELVDRVEESRHPVIVLGDINARPTMCTRWRRPPVPEDDNVVAYRTLEEAGLREVWPLTHPRRPCHPDSWTSGQSDLLGPNTLSHRIDVVFIGDRLTALRSTVVGDEERERSEPTGLWPSDHAATVAEVRLDAAPWRGGPKGDRGAPHGRS